MGMHWAILFGVIGFLFIWCFFFIFSIIAYRGMRIFDKSLRPAMSAFIPWTFVTMILGLVIHDVFRSFLSLLQMHNLGILNALAHIVSITLAGVIVRAFPYIHNHLRMSSFQAGLCAFFTDTLFQVVMVFLFGMFVRYSMPKLEEMKQHALEAEAASFDKGQEPVE